MLSFHQTTTRGHFHVACPDPYFDIVYWNLVCGILREHPSVRSAAPKEDVGSPLGKCYMEVQAPELEGGLRQLKAMVADALRQRVATFTALLRAAETMADDSQPFTMSEEA